MAHPIFSEEHELIRAQLHRFVDERVKPEGPKWEEAGFVPRDVLRQMGELGFLSLRVPEALGGAGLDARASVVLAEEVGRSTHGGFAITVLVHTDMASPHLLRFGNKRQLEKYLPDIMAGRTITAVGVTEPGAGSDVAGIRTRAVRDNGEWVINGSKTYITNGHRADFIVLVTKTDPDAGYDGFTLFLVDMDLPGVIREKKLEKLGMHASDTALLAFNDVRVPDDAILGEVGKGFYHIMWELQGERLIGAAGCVSGAQRAFDRTMQYALERKAFGREIGHFQVIRHKFADMATKIEAARQLVYTTAWRFQSGEYPVREISMAKLYASQIAVEVADECIQIHGGAGYMKEYGIERAWRDLRLNRIGAGTDEIMLDVIGRSYGL
jgi:alkylation response protein AidB-like acyl-CoA dehydrogenase